MTSRLVHLEFAVAISAVLCMDIAQSASTANSSLVQRSLEKRDVNSVTDSVTFALNAIGVIESVKLPATGALPLLIGAVLSFIYSRGGSGDPIQTLQNMIYEERANRQKMILVGYRNRLELIKRELEKGFWRANVRWARDDLRNIYGDLGSARCQFMHVDDWPEKSAIYFIDFANLHLSVNQMILYEFPDEKDTWRGQLVTFAKDYIRYARYVYRFMAFKQELRGNMQKFCEVITSWTSLLPDADQVEVRYENAIRNDEVVAFKRPWTLDWLSCWVSGSLCGFRSCSGGNNPMERGIQYEYWWKCRGEVFMIRLASESSCSSCHQRYIRNGDFVGIQYSQHWWLGADNFKSQFSSVSTRPCPGEGVGRLERDECPWEKWQIVGDTCDSDGVLQDYSTVKLLHDNNPYIGGVNFHAENFSITRANVDRHSATAKLLCK